jgi:Lon protease-like protein
MAEKQPSAERIPLFPLELVLFPGVPLPLHIFEPRYKEMIGLCLDQGLEFGVVLARGEQVALTGCTAEILNVVQKYPDGRMDIVTMGRRVFRVEELIDEKAYYEANVTFVSDEAGSEFPAHRLQALMGLYDECHRAIFGRGPEPLNESESLTYQVATELPVELEAKQALLELRSEGSRQEHLFSYLSHWLPRLRRIEKMKARAGGNGHG